MMNHVGVKWPCLLWSDLSNAWLPAKTTTRRDSKKKNKLTLRR